MLKKYKERVDQSLEKYFNRKFEEVQKTDSLAGQAVNMIASFTLSGGKRIRPALVYYSYLASGGEDCDEIVEASMGIELIHTFLLIHDDIIDRDKKRHGIATVHEEYKRIGEQISSSKDSEHFGNSMAIITGDLAYSMANEIVFNIKFPPEVIIKALDKLQNIVYTTIPGEMLDVVMENRRQATEEEILKMFEGKTSRYTFEGPLHFGSILANSNPKTLEVFTRYSLPLGKAFQIRDDILGVFGFEEKLGKPVGSDIIEGKQTLLLVKALERSDEKQKNMIQKYLGKKDLNNKELEEFRRVLIETGSLKYCQDLSEKFVGEALSALKEIDFQNEEAKVFFENIAQYIVKREV